MIFYKKLPINLKLLFFVISFLLISILLIIIINKNSDYFFIKATDIKLKLFENRKIDVAFFGSSQIHYGISALTIEKDLKNKFQRDINVVNFGLPSASLLEQSFLLEYLIKNQNAPKVVVVPYSSFDSLKYQTDSRFYYGAAYIFEKELSIRKIFKLYRDYEIPLKYILELVATNYLPYYTHRRELKDSFSSYLQTKTVNRQEINFKGINSFINYYGDLSDDTITPSSIDEIKNISNRMIEQAERNLKLAEKFNLQIGLNRFVEIAKKNNIKLVLLYLPTQMDAAFEYSKNSIIKEQIIAAKEIGIKYANINNISFIDGIKDNRFSFLGLSQDKFHLNYFSSKSIAKTISSELINKHFIEASDIQRNELPLWVKEYNYIEDRNLINKSIIDIDWFIIENMEDNDYVFEQKLRNILLKNNKEDVEKLIDFVFTKYIHFTHIGKERYNIFLANISKIELDKNNQDKIINYLNNNYTKIIPDRINSELLLLDSLKTPKAKELLNKIFKEIKEKKLYKQNLSYFLYAHNFVFSNPEYRDLLSKHEQENILYLIESGVLE